MTKNISEYSFGESWDFLRSRGWDIIPSERKVGTAACDGPNKRILVKPFVYDHPNLRVIKYVMPHEIWHALHYELRKYECDKIQLDMTLNKRSAIEVVADGGCIVQNSSRAMKAWVRASVIWHGKVGYSYRWTHVVDRSTVNFCTDLIKEMQELLHASS